MLKKKFARTSLCDSFVLHCATPLRTIFASLARAHERALTKRDFPQAKLESELNAIFLLRTFARNFSNIDFFSENFTLERS